MPDPALAEIAAIARREAPTRCASSGLDCDWYHGAWPTLRLTGTVSGIQGDATFFRRALADGARDGDRVLITAAADQAMLEQVLDAYGDAGAMPDVTVIDRCDTALELNRAYAVMRNATLRTDVGDIVDWRAPASFDLVCTHSILSFVPAERRAALYANWRALLARGGRLVISQAVRPGFDGDALRRFSHAEIEHFVERARGDAAHAGIDLDSTQLDALARRFAEHKSAYVVTSIDELERALRDAGFELVTVERHARGHRYASASPDAPDAIVNVRILAHAC